MSRLHAYITSSGTKQSALAQELGVSRGYLSELVGGTKTPSLDLAFRIERVTGGQVPAKSWTADVAAQEASDPATAAADHSQPMDPAA